MPEPNEVLSFRVPPHLKQALEEAAEADSRSLSSLAVKYLTDRLCQEGFLKTKPKKRLKE